MQQDLADALKAYDETVSADATRLKRWLNKAQQVICGMKDWPFLYATEIVQTITDFTTGTIATTSGSTSVTFSSAPTTSKTNFYLQTSSSNDWYQITAHTASSTSATISPAATTTATAATLKVRKLFYATSTPLQSITDIKKLVNGLNLVSMSRLRTDMFLPLYYDAGDPTGYCISQNDSSGDAQFSLVNPPSSTLNLNVQGMKTVADMSADSDTSLIPDRWHSAIVDIAAGYGFESINDPMRSQYAFARGNKTVLDMARIYDPNLGTTLIMRRPDEGRRAGQFAWVLPPAYGPEA